MEAEKGGGTFGIDKQLSMMRYINIRSENIAVGDAEREQEGSRKDR